MAVSEDRWFEVWFIYTVDLLPTHLLIVTPDKLDSSKVVVIDSQDGEIIREGYGYEETKDWLLEDEYSMIRGREFPDDGW